MSGLRSSGLVSPGETPPHIHTSKTCGARPAPAPQGHVLRAWTVCGWSACQLLGLFWSARPALAGPPLVLVLPSEPRGGEGCALVRLRMEFLGDGGGVWASGRPFLTAGRVPRGGSCPAPGATSERCGFCCPSPPEPAVPLVGEGEDGAPMLPAGVPPAPSRSHAASRRRRFVLEHGWGEPGGLSQPLCTRLTSWSVYSAPSGTRSFSGGAVSLQNTFLSS